MPTGRKPMNGLTSSPTTDSGITRKRQRCRKHERRCAQFREPARSFANSRAVSRTEFAGTARQNSERAVLSEYSGRQVSDTFASVFERGQFLNSAHIEAKSQFWRLRARGNPLERLDLGHELIHEARRTDNEPRWTALAREPRRYWQASSTILELAPRSTKSVSSSGPDRISNRKNLALSGFRRSTIQESGASLFAPAKVRPARSSAKPAQNCTTAGRLFYDRRIHRPANFGVAPGGTTATAFDTNLAPRPELPMATLRHLNWLSGSCGGAP
jgi:hypothetical protein